MNHPARQLLLIRHGKAAVGRGVTDFDRPLKARGGRDALTLGRHLAAERLVPDCIVSSPALRARRTAELICQGIGGGSAGGTGSPAGESDAGEPRPMPRLLLEPDLYLASARTLLQHLRQTPAEVARLALVGHNPGLEECVMLLSGQTDLRRADGKLLTTAAFALLELPTTWVALEPGGARCVFVRRPGEFDAAQFSS